MSNVMNKRKAKERSTRFWNQFKKYLQEVNSPIKVGINKTDYGRLFFRILPGVTIVSTTSIDNKRNCVEVLLQKTQYPNIDNKATNKGFYYQLEEKKEPIERKLDLSLKLEWGELKDKDRSKISAYKDVADPEDENDWRNQHEWLEETIKKFIDVFPDYVKAINPKDWNPEK